MSLFIAVSVANAVNADEVRIDTDNYTLNGDIVLAVGQRIRGSVVLIVHGTLAHKDMDLIETLQDAFQEAGQNSLAINLSLNIDDRSGFYPCDVLHTHRSKDALQEIGVWIDWLTEQGASEVFLLGHSRGANQVARFVATDNRNVEFAVLLAPTIENSALKESALQGTATGLHDAVLKDISFLHCENTDVLSSAYLSYYGVDSDSDTIPVIAKTRVPTLVISGSEDKTTAEIASRLAEIETLFVSHKDIPGAGHFFRDLYAYDVVDAVTEYIRRPAEPALIELATSLRDDGVQSRATGRPIVIFISQENCEYCQLLRSRVLFPMMRAGAFSDIVILRELTLDAGFSLQDFDGVEIAGRVFAERYGVYVTPTLLFLDGGGRSLADPIIGTSTLDYYEFFLTRAIDEAARAVRQ